MNFEEWSQERCVIEMKEKYDGEDVKFVLSISCDNPLLYALKKLARHTKLMRMISGICGDYTDRRRVAFAFRYVLEFLGFQMRITKKKWTYRIETFIIFPNQFMNIYTPSITMIRNKQWEDTMLLKRPIILLEELVERIYDSDDHAMNVLDILSRDGQVIISYLDGKVFDI